MEREELKTKAVEVSARLFDLIAKIMAGSKLPMEVASLFFRLLNMLTSNTIDSTAIIYIEGEIPIEVQVSVISNDKILLQHEDYINKWIRGL